MVTKRLQIGNKKLQNGNKAKYAPPDVTQRWAARQMSIQEFCIIIQPLMYKKRRLIKPSCGSEST
jgi:hypothetical protein